MREWIERVWYQRKTAPLYLKPLAWLFGLIVFTRRQIYRHGGKGYRAPVPVIVIGNITVGGTGKSPLTAWLAGHLKTLGWKPLIVSRGYGGEAPQYPVLVDDTTPANEAGDEPLMLWEQTGLPVIVDPDRPRGVRWALEKELGNIVICDDGLQHYALERDFEIVVFDGARALGNGSLLPAGPLREPIARLQQANVLVVTGHPDWERFPDGLRHSRVLHAVTLVPTGFRALVGDEKRPKEAFAGKPVHAVAGIGHPERFFETLRELGCEVIEHPFADHHTFKPADLAWPDHPVVMTAKDAVKCRQLAQENTWILEVEAHPDPGVETALDNWLRKR
ncbi:tetraacyldisaccharide 4'-kinase [Marinobacteraceae bacterium S3BR75-40.1]